MNELDIKLKKNNSKILNKYKYLYFSLNEFTSQNFVKEVVNNFKLNSTYSILIKISCENHTLFKMCGRQIGVAIKDEHNLDFYANLYSVINNRIDSVLNDYVQIQNILGKFLRTFNKI
jgi:predicted hydrocarbon binding protein